MPRSQTTLYQVEVITSARRLNTPAFEQEDEDGNGKALKRRKHRKSKWEYFVKWAGYGSDENSWEPEKNFRRGCEYLLASFWKHVPIRKDENVYPGFQIDAEEKWIKQELKRFRYWQKLDSRIGSQKQKQYKTTSGRPGEAWVEELFNHAGSTSSSSHSSIMSADNSDSNNEPSVSKRKLDKVNNSNEERPLVITIPPQKRIKPSSPASIESEVEPNEVSESNSSREDPQLPGQLLNVETTLEGETASLFSFSEPVSPGAASGSPPLLYETSSFATVNTPPTISQGLQLLDSQAQDVLSESTSENVSNQHGLSTKQRLSFGALALRPPKVISGTVSGSKNQVPPFKANSASLMPLSLKKGVVPTSSMVTGGCPELHEPTLSSINAIPSPSHYTQDNLDVESLQTRRVQDHDLHGETDDKFLEEFTFCSFTNVLKPPEEYSIESLHPQSPISERFPISNYVSEFQSDAQLESAFLSPSQDSWSWSGNVFTDTESSTHAFSITMNGVTPIVNGGPSFHEVLTGMEHLLFTSFHDAVDIDSILPACQEIRQFAALDPRSSADIEDFDLFCTYMAKMHKVVLLPIFLNGSGIGHILFHPNTIFVTSRLKIPLRKDRGLAAALVLWALSESQLSGQPRYIDRPNQYSSSKTDFEPLLENRSLWFTSIQTRPWYHHGIRILKFPRMLHNYLCENAYERTYNIWYEDGDGTRKRPGVETRTLYGILDKCGCSRSRIQEARIVFIHVGAIKYLHKLPGFLDICSTSFSVQLYTYGSHETIPCKLWGVREIYPCGGIVTFTPQALLDDFSGVIHRIVQIRRHPLWACYIIPSVLGMVVTVYSQREGTDPISDFDSGKLPYTTILTAIEDGELSLLSSPPNDNSYSKKDIDEWLEKFWTRRPGDSRATLQACLNMFSNRYQGSLQTQWTCAILDEISKDLRCMRTQPVFMENYRRYVVLDSPRAHQKTHEDALEWTSTTKFDFKDDFFPKQE